ncbi:four-helix bundle copper-binding protein [Haladaptatus sp. R4]|uniref:four-helix bundle copper-binding protein n=1 Tax=Haladaptatus sp. R4 TaxID=1679489 RepID=UPI000AF51E12|nr:four-helix bundle copper-binding protein [Haladaptatus sp. R4]
MTQQRPMQHSQARSGGGNEYGTEYQQGYGQPPVSQQRGRRGGIGQQVPNQGYGGETGPGGMGQREMAQGGTTQRGGIGQQIGRGMTQPGGQFDDQLPGEMRVALEDFEQAAKVCDWCADKCLDEGPEMAECIRLCRDVADLGTLNTKLIARDSVFGPELAEIFANAAEECASECMRHQNPHCQECASVLSRAVDSTYRLLDQLGTTGQEPSTGGIQQEIMGEQSRF